MEIKFALGLLLLPLVACNSITKLTKMGTRIVGGDYAEENQFPHQIALFRSEFFTCGGSIISASWVLTAAHCVAGSLNPALYRIHAGSNYLYKGGVSRKVVEVISHEKYGNFMNDVALLKVDKPFEFNESVKAIELLNEEVPVDGNVIISGFGKTSNSAPPSQRLKFNTLQAMDTDQCQRTVSIYHGGIICLKHPKNNGACNGDSGGSATYDGKLCGVANFVMGGCGSANPDGYAKVSYFYDWIQNKTQEAFSR